jgi:ubiquinone/menaquinone biosynthesis C-methylase UbiE
MNSLPVDPASATLDAKAAVRDQWDRCAQGWNDHAPSIRRWLAPATAAMLDMAGVRPGDRVLDVAAGAGDQTLDIARRVGPDGLVLATDLSPAILQHAKANAEREGLTQVQTRVGDGEQLPVDSGSFDAVVCRLGLMLFTDPLQGLREMHRALRPGAGVCTLVFSAPEANPCIGILMRTALRHAGLPPRDPFQPGGLLSLGKRGLLDELFHAAGFHEVATTAVDAPFHLPSVTHYISFVRASASPIHQILGRLTANAAKAAWDDIELQLSAFSTVDGWVGPNELLLTAARKP